MYTVCSNTLYSIIKKKIYSFVGKPVYYIERLEGTVPNCHLNINVEELEIYQELHTHIRKNKTQLKNFTIINSFISHGEMHET